MVYYCPFCWNEIGHSSETCPGCGSDLRAFSSLPYEDKLLAALHHPVPENRLLAIQILGEIQSERALPDFETFLGAEEDIFVMNEVVRALAAIGTERSLLLLSKASNHRFSPVRHLAAELLPTAIDKD